MKPITLYVGAICVAGLAVLPFVDWGLTLQFVDAHKWGFTLLVLLGLASEHQSVSTGVGASGGSHTITFIPLLASTALFGPAATIVFIGIIGTIAEFGFRKKGLLRGSFNVFQYILSTAIAGWIFLSLGGVPLVALENWVNQQILPFAAFSLCLLTLNQAFVAGAISLSQGQSFRATLRKLAGKSGAAILYDLLISPIALVVAFLYSEAGSTGLVIAVFPLLFIRHAYLLNFWLQEANRDLLKALVKAIETRDPYTSGHSRRVQMLAGRIASSMGLSEARAGNIENAALLHDIGKIDAVYDDILKKPSELSDDERRMIESHVSKGVELLKSLASFPKEVVDSVRGHHEREDGAGYPDGLMGDDISLGAKIISVCDAVDAMLSDRPYRDGLPLEMVRRELIECAGTQFDGNVVAHAVRGDLLEGHLAQISAEKQALGMSIGSLEGTEGVRTSRQTQSLSRAKTHLG